MTETTLAPTPAAALSPIARTADVVQIAEWAAELDAAHRLGQMLAASNFLPDNIRKKGKDTYKTEQELATDATAIILAGKSVGLDPMQSVQNIFPVNGRPSMYARTAQALLIAAGHDVERLSADDEHVTVRARRRGGSWREYTWTIERAEKAGYTSNPLYKKDPVAMLTAKAIMEACRLTAPECLLGMSASVEEAQLEDLGELDQPKDEPAPKPKTKVTRKPRAAAQPPAPELPDDANRAKADSGPDQQEERDWAALVDSATTADELRALWKQAKAEGAEPWVIEMIEAAGNPQDGTLA